MNAHREVLNTRLLAVDIGNTAVKAALFSAIQPADGTLPMPDFTAEAPAAAGNEAALPDSWPLEGVPWFVSSVNRPLCERLFDWHARRGLQPAPRLLELADLPLRVDVDFPERVGLDRLATAVAADWLRAPARPAVVVDAGTALKVHALSADGVFLGGAILPGMRLASESLHANTDRLPRVPVSTNDVPPAAMGRHTEAAIRSGIYWGAVGAVRELLARMRVELAADPQVFITGGDAAGLSPLIDHDTRFVPHLCLAGIALIAHHCLTRSGEFDER
ncbi:MAG: Type pantothenate kinase [Planctomycetota bacterium]|jgi:type III pantothenate kinase